MNNWNCVTLAVVTYLICPSILHTHPGVWQLRVFPLLYQHISGPALWPPGLGSHIWWPRGGGRLWEPLLQGLPLPTVDTRDSHLKHRKHWRHNQCIPQGAMIFPVQPFVCRLTLPLWCELTIDSIKGGRRWHHPSHFKIPDVMRRGGFKSETACSLANDLQVVRQWLG